MRIAAALAFALVVVGAGLALAQIWLAPWPYETFFKLIVSDGIVLALVAAAAFFLRERRETERLRNDRRLD